MMVLHSIQEVITLQKDFKFYNIEFSGDNFSYSPEDGSGFESKTMLFSQYWGIPKYSAPCRYGPYFTVYCDEEPHTPPKEIIPRLPAPKCVPPFNVCTPICKVLSVCESFVEVEICRSLVPDYCTRFYDGIRQIDCHAKAVSSKFLFGWNLERLLWIGHIKEQDSRDKCMLYLLPKDIIQRIIGEIRSPPYHTIFTNGNGKKLIFDKVHPTESPSLHTYLIAKNCLKPQSPNPYIITVNPKENYLSIQKGSIIVGELRFVGTHFSASSPDAPAYRSSVWNIEKAKVLLIDDVDSILAYSSIQ